METKVKEKQHYYFDKYNISLNKFDYIWRKLYEFFYECTPKSFIVEHIDGTYSYSGFPNILYICNNHYNNRPFYSVSHESSHICLANMTNNRSMENRFKFLDEGFADYFSYYINQTLGNKIKQLLSVAHWEYKDGNLSFAKLQEWEECFYDTKSKNAYDVSCSFIHFVVERFGFKKLRQFFLSIRQTNDLNTSLQEVFHLDMGQMETSWFSFLESITFDIVPPEIIQIYPDLNYPVRPDIDYIEIEFTQDMNINVYFRETPDFIEMKNAVWTNARILRIMLPNHLKQNTDYEIQLNLSEQNRYFTSKRGDKFSTVVLKFITSLI